MDYFWVSSHGHLGLVEGWKRSAKLTQASGKVVLGAGEVWTDLVEPGEGELSPSYLTPPEGQLALTGSFDLYFTPQVYTESFQYGLEGVTVLSMVRTFYEISFDREFESLYIFLTALDLVTGLEMEGNPLKTDFVQVFDLKAALTQLF